MRDDGNSTIARAAAWLAWLVALLFIAFAAAPAAQAQNVARGQQLYAQLGCNTSNCHGANPGENLRNVLAGAGSPSAIEYATAVRSEMNSLQTWFDFDPNYVLDLAAYLATVPQVAPPPPPPAPPPPTATMVEYFHAGFGHYFVTNIAAEIAALDNGSFAGWARTGKTFKAYASGNASVVPVCRFFTVAYAPKSSHFYTPFTAECDGLKNGGTWQYEGDAFFVNVPETGGICAPSAQPVYRMYNNGLGGAPNHRYTTDVTVRSEMLAKGWVAEGLGAQGVIFCVPL
ncbi:MAG TPA: hypothetical protein VNE58_01450 [Casimicrobiaceae bacterium]|nr:hypothetical protein [Casimicrobiaceae bacterium]